MANNNQGRRDRFCPTDLELVACCFRPKTESEAQNTNRCGFCHEVYVYDDNPDDLTEKYKPAENKWYFLTSKLQKHTNENLGTWKATSKDTMVCDDVTQRVLGRKKSLAYFDANKLKTPWRMHEYTLNDPKIVTTGSRGHYKDNNKMANWVLCKIYKEKNLNVNINVEY